MRIKYVDFGNILAWIIAIVLFSTNIISFEIFILFVLLKLEFRLDFRS